MPGVYAQEDLERHFARINERLGAIEHQLKVVNDDPDEARKVVGGI